MTAEDLPDLSFTYMCDIFTDMQVSSHGFLILNTTQNFLFIPLAIIFIPSWLNSEVEIPGSKGLSHQRSSWGSIDGLPTRAVTHWFCAICWTAPEHSLFGTARELQNLPVIAQ